MDAAGNIPGEGGAPREDDFGICLNCGEWMVFTKDLKLRAPTQTEFAEIGASFECARVRMAWVAIAKDRRKNQP
jgi:hypothetical protein